MLFFKFPREYLYNIYKENNISKYRSKEYNTWIRIKDRCYNKNSKLYKTYGEIGLLMDESMRNDFEVFLAEVGEVPDTISRWSIDRLDSSKGYVKGNMRWATDKQQARNRCKMGNNTSGHTGVYWMTDGKKSTYAACRWYVEENGAFRAKQKYFSVSKYGLLPSFVMALKYREEQINSLNNLGYGYTENHGK